jgi:hypothetical protein
VKTSQKGTAETKLLILTARDEEILRAMHFYRYMTAVDVAHLLYKPSVLTAARRHLARLSGGGDEITNQYLYRFPLPQPTAGNKERIYTLGSRGRDFLVNEVGLPVAWYFRPEKVRHMSIGQVTHHLTLTRFLVAAQVWSKKQSDFTLPHTRTSYELAKSPATVEVTQGGNRHTVTVVPDAWLKFEQLQAGTHVRFHPILLEIDRGTEHQQKFKQHVRARLEFIKKGGLYSRVFGTEAVMIAYATTGQKPEYRETRRQAMCAWTQEVLVELQKENWASVFRFHSLNLDDLYNTPLFAAPVWYRPDRQTPLPLFTA